MPEEGTSLAWRYLHEPSEPDQPTPLAACHLTLLDDLDHAGVVFRSATEPFDTSTPAGRMLVQMLGVFAEFE